MKAVQFVSWGIIAAFIAIRSVFAADSSPLSFEFAASGEGTTVVSHPGAQTKKALAIDINPVTGSCRLKGAFPRIEAGVYRVTLYSRLHAAPDDDLSRSVIEFTLGDGKSPRLKKKMAWTQFDSTADRFTPIVMDLTLAEAMTPTIDISWQQVTGSSAERVRPIRKIEPPAAGPKLTTNPAAGKKPASAGDDLLSEIQNENKLTPLADVNYPAFLIDRLTFEPLSRTQFVETVRPQYLHTYPGEPNPIRTTLVNLERQSVEAEVQLEIRAGLDELLHTDSQKVTLPAGKSVACEFKWPGNTREFGYEARVALFVGGKPIHAASDYFSVSFPIWKTAIQASGFLDWYGREKQFPEHVDYNRAHYLNVEEAFSWQPSSWTNLNPEGEHWWSGQGDVHNSRAGLQEWIRLSHEQGIKMITYLWPSASGREGLEWGRANPELITHVETGLAAEFLDVEDLRLKPLVESNPRLWRLRSSIWNNVGINRGMLRTIDKGIEETIQSAKKFGWDGARFDSPPSWSAMSASDMHSEFAQLKVNDVIKELVPEYYEQKDGTWSGEAVSVTNARYARHRFRKHDPHFALSFNDSDASNRVGLGEESKFFDTLCAEGGQIMDEAIRQMRAPWREYFARVQRQGEATRKRGGFHCVVSPNASSAVTRCYASIATFVGGSHPYLDFGWGQPLPGNYPQFMTRYGEYCWGRDLAIVPADKTAFEVENDTQLWWRDSVRNRTLSNGGSQWVLQLVSAPPTEQMAATTPGRMQPWRQGIVVGRPSEREPIVWALSAEPTTTAIRLIPRRSGNRYVVEIPEHRVWTTVVWTEPSS